MPSAAPIRPASPVSTQQGVEISLRNDLTPFRKACIFTTLRFVKTHALRLSRTKNLHFAVAPFPRFSAIAVLKSKSIDFLKLVRDRYILPRRGREQTGLNSRRKDALSINNKIDSCKLSGFKAQTSYSFMLASSSTSSRTLFWMTRVFSGPMRIICLLTGLKLSNFLLANL